MSKITEISTEIRQGKIKAKDLVLKHLKKIKETDSEINSFITLLEDRALDKAELVDEEISKGNDPGQLAGIPVAIKDNMQLLNVRTTCASKILENYISPYTAAAVEKLESSGAIIIGKTNMDEFAMGSSGETSAYGFTKNPSDITRIPGGSSSGSAASVASGQVIASLGSDTGGSIRQPASLCGIVGLKPTYGLVSRYGLIAFASSLDQIGPFGSTVTDTQKVFSVISGYDEKDSTSINREIEDYSLAMDNGVKGLKIGIPKEYFGGGLSDEIRERINDTIGKLEKEGASFKEISLPRTEYAVATYYIVAPAEASANLARYDGVKYGYRTENPKDLKEEYFKTRKEGFGAEVKRRIMLGTYALSSGYYEAYYLKAQKVRTLLMEDFKSAFSEVDLIISPTTPTTAFKLGEKTDDPLQMYLSDVYTISCNLAGIPGISIPVGSDSNNLPIGLQLLGDYFSEGTLFQCARQIERFYEQ